MRDNYFMKRIPGIGLCLCTRLLKEGDKLKECCIDQVERTIDHFETILPAGIWSFTDGQYIHAGQAWKILGIMEERNDALAWADNIRIKDYEELI